MTINFESSLLVLSNKSIFQNTINVHQIINFKHRARQRFRISHPCHTHGILNEFLRINLTVLTVGRANVLFDLSIHIFLSSIPNFLAAFAVLVFTVGQLHNSSNTLGCEIVFRCQKTHDVFVGCFFASGFGHDFQVGAIDFITIAGIQPGQSNHGVSEGVKFFFKTNEGASGVIFGTHDLRARLERGFEQRVLAEGVPFTWLKLLLDKLLGVLEFLILFIKSWGLRRERSGQSSDGYCSMRA
mmetsp:Transcript_3925/g.6561  ORF Transcript_3925/g.6561 Transcript_3925/m.6561 type:complete len:242 (-) Transcript_3925:50-775(-)